MYTAEVRTPAIQDGLAIASLILSLLWLGGIGSLLAVIFGHASRGQAKRQGRSTSALATAGCIIGWLGLIVAISIIVSIFEHMLSNQAYVNCVNTQISDGYQGTC